jgi:hypothetical protein
MRIVEATSCQYLTLADVWSSVESNKHTASRAGVHIALSSCSARVRM